MLGNHHQQQTERRPGSRRRRRGRSGEGIVKANRKTEICLHWRNGTCPYGAGSCAFAHGLGELRHPTMDDETIADTVSEDSGSCPPSPRDPSPAHGPRQHSRDRRLPTFVHLSAGNTPDTSRAGAGSSSTPTGPPHALGAQAAHRGRQRERTHPWPPSAHANVHGCSTLLDLPVPAPASTFGSEFSASSWTIHPGSHSSSSNPGMAIYSGGSGESSSSVSSSAMSSSFMSPRALQPLMVQASQTNQQQQMGWEGAHAGGTPGGHSTFPHQNGAGPAWW